MGGVKAFFWRIPLQLRFLMVGGFNTAAGIGLALAYQYLLGKYMPPQMVFAISWLTNTVPAFMTMKHLAFRSSGPYVREYLRYVSASLTNFLLGVVILSLFVNVFKVNPYLSQFLTISINALLAYILLKFFAFRKRGGLAAEKTIS